MENFELMMTCTLRPELVKRTLDSHIHYLFKDDINSARLIINVDIVGSNKPETDFQKIMDCLSVIPFRSVCLNIGDIPSFSRAFYWCLGQIEAPMTFNLEEDWEMKKELDFHKMVQLFEDRDLVHLRLSSFKSTNEDTMKTWNKFIPWNGDYFEIPRNLRGTIGWAGHPSLNRSSFLIYFASIINPERNPEKQIKGAYPIILNSKFGVFHPKNELPIIKDIGRQWMKDNGYQKKGTKAFFTEWEKISKGDKNE